MAPQYFTHPASLMMPRLPRSIYAPKPKKIQVDVAAPAAISLCSLGRASHEYEDIQE